MRHKKFEKTIKFYEENALQYFKATSSVDMQEIRSLVTSSLSPGDHILDAGCGSGRDLKEFKQLGFKVSAFDASAALAKLAQEHAQTSVSVCTFEEFNEPGPFNAIFCNASLLHLDDLALSATFENLLNKLAPKGLLVATFKKGFGYEIEPTTGRFFNYMSAAKLDAIIHKICPLFTCETSEIEDKMGRSQSWLIAKITKSL